MTLDDIISYLKEFDPELKLIQNESNSYDFQKIEHFQSYSLLSEISVPADFYSASIRVFIGSYFKQWDEEEIYPFINQLNANFRFASFYFTQNTLILEQDVLFESQEELPALIDYLLLLTAHAKDVLISQSK